jgi:hypothetical protein
MIRALVEEAAEILGLRSCETMDLDELLERRDEFGAAEHESKRSIEGGIDQRDFERGTETLGKRDGCGGGSGSPTSDDCHEWSERSRRRSRRLDDPDRLRIGLMTESVVVGRLGVGSQHME